MKIKPEIRPAYANLFNINVNDMVRINFADQVDGNSPEVHHTSMIMTGQNALALANLIIKLVEDHNKAINPDA